MADYDPLIPQPSDNLSTSQGQILNNFTELNNIFDADHFTWNNATVGNRGLHREVTFPAVKAVDPTPSGVSSVIYTKTVSGASTAFFANASGASALWAGGGTGLVSLTGSGNDSIGSMTLGNGVIVKWGNIATIDGFVTPYSFAVAFPTACFNVIVCCDAAAGQSSFAASVINSTVTAAGFSVKQTSLANRNVRFFAIGN